MPAESPARPVDPAQEAGAREFFAPGPGEADVPAYALLRRRVLTGRSDGTLPAGTRLPPVRTLAGWLGLAPNTVARAYKELEAAGAVEGRGRAGSFVRAASSGEQKALRRARTYLAEVEALGYTPEEALALLRRALED